MASTHRLGFMSLGQIPACEEVIWGKTPTWCSIHTDTHARNQIHRGNSIHHISRAEHNSTSGEDLFLEVGDFSAAAVSQLHFSECQSRWNDDTAQKRITRVWVCESGRCVSADWSGLVSHFCCDDALFILTICSHHRWHDSPSYSPHDSYELLLRCWKKLFKKSVVSFGLGLAGHLPVKRIAGNPV